MPLNRRSGPARCWLLMLSALGVALGVMAQWVLAAPHPGHEPAKAGAGARIALDARELKWIAEHPPVKVASLEYPRLLFKNEQGQWSGLNRDSSIASVP